jgi:hypothetical protein
VNVLFDGLPIKQSQKATRREVLNIEPAVPTPLRWAEVPITFSRADQWTSFFEPIVAGSRLNKVLIDGGSGLNVLFTKTLKKMKLNITHMLTKSTSPFYSIVPENAAIPLGSVVLLVTFGETRENYQVRSCGLRDFLPCHPRQTDYREVHGGTPLHILGTQNAKSCWSTFTARGLEDILRLRHRGCGTRSYQSSTQCNDGDLCCIQKLAPTELEIPEKSDTANKHQPSEEVQVKAIDLGTGDSSKTTMIGAVLDPK